MAEMSDNGRLSATDRKAESGDLRIRSIAIVGGGSAGWLAASMLARATAGNDISIRVIESPEIGIVGVGEATIPPIIDLLRYLRIDEADFINHTNATFKLGIKFIDWRQPGHSYWHPFGTFGTPINGRPFYHCWQRARQAGMSPRFNDFSICAALGDAGRFHFPSQPPDSTASGVRYALHFDATLVAQYLRAYSERLGVQRLELTVCGTTLASDGTVSELRFSDGAALQADLYI
ncbi:MAG: tryptophan 7-halogenase, partial [Sinobacteraceae bacterium]|nr:tryptophan 7-halogenase [Nevskiaceae bacterium]